MMILWKFCENGQIYLHKITKRPQKSQIQEWLSLFDGGGLNEFDKGRL